MMMSVTKAFTATCAHLVVDDIDRPVASVWPRVRRRRQGRDHDRATARPHGRAPGGTRAIAGWARSTTGTRCAPRSPPRNRGGNQGHGTATTPSRSASSWARSCGASRGSRSDRRGARSLPIASISICGSVCPTPKPRASRSSRRRRSPRTRSTRSRARNPTRSWYERSRIPPTWWSRARRICLASVPPRSRPSTASATRAASPASTARLPTGEIAVPPRAFVNRVRGVDAVLDMEDAFALGFMNPSPMRPFSPNPQRVRASRRRGRARVRRSRPPARVRLRAPAHARGRSRWRPALAAAHRGRVRLRSGRRSRRRLSCSDENRAIGCRPPG